MAGGDRQIRVINGYQFKAVLDTTSDETVYSLQEAEENSLLWRRHPEYAHQKIICCSD